MTIHPLPEGDCREVRVASDGGRYRRVVGYVILRHGLALSWFAYRCVGQNLVLVGRYPTTEAAAAAISDQP